MDLRKFEIVWRAFWMRLLAAMLPGRDRALLPSPTDSKHRVLVIRYERIGDMIMATSLIRNIANALPARKVDVLATPTTAAVLERNPYVGEVLTLDRRSFASYWNIMKQLRRSRYTVMVDGRINNPPVFTSTPLLMLAGRAPYRVGAGGDKKPRIYNVSVPAWNRSDHYIDGSKELVVPFGVDPTTVDWQPELFLSADEIQNAEAKWREAETLAAQDVTPRPTGKRLLVNLSASEPKRRWPDGKFIATLQSVRGRSPAMPVVVMGLPREWSSVEKVANAVKALPVPTPNLRDAFALVQTSDLVFTPDTSISHAASAFRKPSLVLLKREHKPYAPYNTPGEIVAWNEDEIQQLPHERVAKALDKLLNEFGS